MPVPNDPIEAYNARLLADAGVTVLVSTRVFVIRPTQDAEWPYLSSFLTSGGDGIRLNGRNNLQNYTVRCEAYALTQASAAAILKAVNAAVNGWRDIANKVAGCFPVGDADEQVNDDGSVVAGQSFSLWFLG